MLKILVLGPPVIRDEDHPVRIQRRLVRNLLLYLACQPDMVSRANLLFMFWENFNEQDARRRLRETLSKLRSQLPDPGILITEQDLVGVDHQKVYIDLDEFKSIYRYSIQAGSQFSREGSLPTLVAQTMDRAIQLWRGQQFLSGAEFYESVDLDQWVTNTQEDLSQKRRRLQLRMADHHISVGNLEQALDYLHPLLLVDELDPDVNFLFLKSLVDLGRISEATYRLQELEKLYRKELSMDLPPLFLDLKNDIKKRFSLQEIPEISKWNISVSTSVPFFGRQEPLDELKRSFQRGGIALLSGEAGSGKTRLVYELYHSIKPTPLLLASSASNLGRTLPFQIIAQMIKDNLVLGERIKDPNWKQQVSRLMPNIFREGTPYSNPESLETPEERIFLFEDIHRYLLDMFKGEKVLFFLDNCQWLDNSTMELLVYLFNKEFFTPTRLLVMASRPDTSIQKLEDWHAGFKNSHSISRVSLNPLDLPSISEMASYMLGKFPSEQTILQLSKLSGGNPYFLIEILRILRQSYAFLDADQNLNQIKLPKSINVLVQDRLNALSKDAQTILMAASVIRNDFTPQQLEEISGIPPEAVVFLLEELETAHFIQPSGTPLPGGSYNFIHEIIPENLYNGLSLARKRFLHQKVANTLEKGTIPIHPSILAYHFEAGGEIIAAIKYWIQAGEEASKLLSKEQVYQAFGKAEELLAVVNYDTDNDLIYRLYSSWGEISYYLFDDQTIKNVYQKMLFIGRQKGDPLLIGSSLSGIATMYSVFNDYQEGINLFNEAIQHLERTQNTYELIRSLNKKGFLQSLFCHFNEAKISLDKALSLGKSTFDPKINRALVSTDIYLAYVEISSAWPHIGNEYAERALEKSRQLGYLNGELRSLLMVIIGQYNIGNYRKVLDLCQRGLQKISIPFLWRVESEIHAEAADSELSLGHLDECLIHLKYNAKFFSQSKLPIPYTNYFKTYGDLYRSLHAFPEAMQSYQKALNDIKVSHASIQILHRMSYTYYLMNQFSESEKVIQVVIDLSKMGDAAQTYLQADLVRALVYAELGRVEEAHAINQAISIEFNKRGLTYQQVSADWVQSFLEYKSQNYEKARQLAQVALQQARHFEMVWLELRVHELLRKLPVSRPGQPYEYIQRIHELLEMIGEHSKSAEIQPFFTKFKRDTLKTFL